MVTKATATALAKGPRGHLGAETERVAAPESWARTGVGVDMPTLPTVETACALPSPSPCYAL